MGYVSSMKRRLNAHAHTCTKQTPTAMQPTTGLFCQINVSPLSIGIFPSFVLFATIFPSSLFSHVLKNMLRSPVPSDSSRGF